MAIELTCPLGDIPDDLKTPIQKWLAQDKNIETIEEVINLCNDHNWTELHSRFDKRITFGTAGLRSSMEAGFSRMNSLVVLQTTQGLATYLKKINPKNLTFVIGHDHRLHSKEFATVTTAIFLKAGFKVYSLNPEEELVHTPLVPFSIDQLGAAAGVMITASHNPMMDNGYKVYYSNGCQIIPPHDHNIAKSINENLEPWVDKWDWKVLLDKGQEEGMLKYVKEDMTTKYLQAVGKQLVDKELVSRLSNLSNKPWFVYTPMHGVGHEIFERITEGLLHLKDGKDYICVPEQVEPDPTFRTVSFPNPEEKGALDLAIALAEKEHIHLVLANDPDADRFSIAVKDIRKGVWKQISGDSIGFLFATYEFQKYQKLDEDFKKKHPLAMVNSTVSSQLIKKMAEVEGFLYNDTLTGFKWIGNRTIDLENEGYYIPLGYEEALGYMFPTMEHDKDGISASTVFLQCYANWILDFKKYPLDILEDGFKKYGYFKQYNGYYKLPNQELIHEIFDFIRNKYEPNGTYPHIIGSQLHVTTFRDLTIGFQSDTPDNKPLLPVDSTSQMITVTATPSYVEGNENIRFTMRGSGTEPKLKVYIEASAETKTRANYLTKLTWEILKKEWFRPDVTGLKTDF
ncbi:similar to Saccharomyces cerevisiae YMR278W PGM3 Phosphoglucomutase, catalyzes interconversion of glucose-1-phosphate and glucose-6-phospate [Maudiozyma barnettii]|uniref:phosphopentomutase n=1 Tax=Maudiozyma barnettii TaxID=61262 RepID=A0A8H2ZEV2_9SACH|nr:phosphoribomutase PRM15 [Kazachstania barnettii]CAB4252626.1 similar to Saccharomyces cerevisiae YMR278W PGM3 Phosphoglucomutase, catalyzes interconversion of glucose-1-phosphate and glucose-6-phospate [Kazachstania barnettii]CAD1780091.1 similar to Saccharomyces cerevisiae YMR278W PGM3 Phosphoglucomutase, catalyzes interconversion of glucose-1-phosphate and glucose-6-phospate [Kazachstania barnettii]